MKHEDVFNQILNNLSNFHKSGNANNSSYWIEKEVTTSLISLYGILSGCSTSFDTKIQQEMAQKRLPCNCSDIKPSLNELLCMCEVNQNLFYSSISSEKEVAVLVSLYITRIWLQKRPDGNIATQWNTEEIMKIGASLCQSYNCKNRQICLKNDEIKFVLLFYYFYLFLVLEKYGLIEDDYEPWKEELVNNWIYLPLEGTVNLVYFNYLINTDKAKFCKAIVYSDGLFKDNEISQYDCGFSANSSKQVNLDIKELIFLLDPSLKTTCDINNDLRKKYIKYPCEWLSCFHILSEKKSPDEKTLKIIKALYDVQNHYSIYKINVCKNNNSWTENNNPYKILLLRQLSVSEF